MNLPHLDKRNVLMLFGVIVLLCITFFAGALWRTPADSDASHIGEHETMPVEEDVWTCSMHPQIKLPKPGKCPICFMDLIPLEGDSDDEGSPRSVTVGKHAAKLMDIETVPVARRYISADIRMIGKIDYDETRVASITAWVPGRLERLYVDYTGIPVRKGDHMVELYSPELLSAQEELLQAVQAANNLQQSDVGIVRNTTQATITAAREKLRLWGLSTEQIANMEKQGTPNEKITIYAPSGGIVIGKEAKEGMYVKTGTPIYTIADLSRVWVNLDAYESDLAWLRYGQQVEFTTESYPGDVFTGTISFIHPVLNEETRTVKVRVNVENEDNRLKPGMFVRAAAQATIGTNGQIMDGALAGKWISPMHPEVIKDGPGACDVCGMDLVPVESLGYVRTESSADSKPLVIPASAPLITGKRAVVYVKISGDPKPTFEGREVILGARGNNEYIVLEGLKEGEMVVTRGAFKLDAELQIRAKPSMMSPSGADTPMQHNHGGHAMTDRTSSEQTHCPIMGGEINKDVYVDYQGKRIYFCCSGCEETFLKDPDAYIKQMQDKGIALEEVGSNDAS